MHLSSSNIPLLEVKNLTTKLQIGRDVWTVVDNINFELYRGKTLALVGESGCGKSMTALSIMRILPSPPALPSEGDVIYQNINLLTLSEKEMRQIRGAKIAMIFQDPMSSLNPVYTIGSQLMEVAELHLKLAYEEAYSRCLATLDQVGIPSPSEIFNTYPHQLSGGLKQRVMIGMALICEPDILIADEPTTALDVTIQAQVLQLITRLQKEKGMALLLITHDMGVVAEMADEVIVMYVAQGIEKGPVQAVFDHRAHPYTMGLFNARAALQTPKKKLNSIKGSVPSFNHIPKGCRFHPRCPYAMEKCKSGTIPNFVIDQNPHHRAMCTLYDHTEESLKKLAEGDNNG